MSTFKLATPTGLLLRSDAANPVSNSNAEITLLSLTIPGAAMSMSNKLKFALWCSLTTTALLPGNVTIKVKYGTAVLTLGGGAIALTGSISSQPLLIGGRMSNKSATNSQYLYGEIRQSSNALVLGNVINQSKMYPAIDSTQDQVFSVTAQFQTADINNILVMEDCELDLS